MRNLLVLGLMIGGAFLAGWFTVDREGDRTTIEIDRSEIRGDARKAIDKGRELLDQRERERAAEEQANSAGFPTTADQQTNPYEGNQYRQEPDPQTPYPGARQPSGQYSGERYSPQPYSPAPYQGTAGPSTGYGNY